MIKLIKSTFFQEAQTKKKLAAFILKSKQLSFGSECHKFEAEFAKWQGCEHSIMLNSGSSANLAVIQALLNLKYLKKGDKVGFSAITWSTNVMPLIQLGLVPVPVDVELDTLNVSSKKVIDTYKNHKLKAFFITNLLGFCDDIEKIAEFCKKKKIVLIEDNCESMGTVYKGKKLGNYGLASTFSFYVGHHMSTVEGGTVCTNDEALETMIRVVRAHGWDRNLSFAKQDKIRKDFNVNSTFYSRYTFYDLGYNMRPTEMAGFLGHTQLKYIDQIIELRQKNYREFAKAIFTDETLFFRPKSEHLDVFSNFAVPVVCKSQAVRDELVKRCEDKLEIRPIVGGNMIMQPFFKRYVKDIKISCPNAQLIHQQGLYFGNNPDLSKKEKMQIIKIFKSLKA